MAWVTWAIKHELTWAKFMAWAAWHELTWAKFMAWVTWDIKHDWHERHDINGMSSMSGMSWHDMSKTWIRTKIGMSGMSYSKLWHERHELFKIMAWAAWVEWPKQHERHERTYFWHEGGMSGLIFGMRVAWASLFLTWAAWASLFLTWAAWAGLLNNFRRECCLSYLLFPDVCRKCGWAAPTFAPEMAAHSGSVLIDYGFYSLRRVAPNSIPGFGIFENLQRCWIPTRA